MRFDKKYFENRLVSGDFFAKGNYEGEVNEGGLCHGKGKWISEDGSFSYDGEWADGMFDGWGWFYFDDFVYEGLFTAGKFDFDGRLFKNDGKLIYDGLWRDGICYDDSWQCLMDRYLWPTYLGRRLSLVISIVLSLIWCVYIIIACIFKCAMKPFEMCFPEFLVTRIFLMIFDYYTFIFESLQNTQGRKFIVGIKPKWVIHLPQKVLEMKPIKIMDGLVKCHKTDCTKFGYSRCSRCQAVAFCSSECAKKHWNKHRRECDKLKQEKELVINLKKQKKLESGRPTQEIRALKESEKRAKILRNPKKMMKRINTMLVDNGNTDSVKKRNKKDFINALSEVD